VELAVLAALVAALVAVGFSRALFLFQYKLILPTIRTIKANSS
jgi:hypothetical protein